MDDQASPPPLSPGTKVREFEIEQKLGEGSFGIVYSATHEILGEKVAVKEFLPRDLARRIEGNRIEALQGKFETYEWAREKFLLEARTLKALADPQPHPNLVQVIHAFPENDTVYMCMRYEESTPLDKLLSQSGPMPEQGLRDILFPLLDGLEHAHAHGVWHRDVKPSNILIRGDGSPVLIDFGAARQAVGDRDRSVMAQCTPGYAAPEQMWGGDEQGPWTDIYGLGATLYRAVTGEPPQGFSRTTLREDYKGRYSGSFLAAIDAALEPKPGDRPQTVTDWRQRFEASAPEPEGVDERTVLRPSAGTTDATHVVVAESAPSPPAEPIQHPEPPVEPAQPRGKPRTWLWASLGVALIALGGVALWWWLPPPQEEMEVDADPASSSVKPDTPEEATTIALVADTEGPPAPTEAPVDVPRTLEIERPPATPAAGSADRTPAARSAILSAVDRLVSDLGCARLDTSLSPEGVLIIAGHLDSREELAELRGRLLALNHVEQVQDSEVAIYGWPFCEVIATLIDATTGADAGTRKAGIAFNKPRRIYREGEHLVVTAMNNNPHNGYIYLDYVDVAGDVNHMLPTPSAPDNRVSGWGEVVVGAEGEQDCRQRQCYEISPPHGRSLLVAIWSRDPLLAGPRSEVVEPATDYASSLASVIRNAGTKELALSYEFLETRR